MERPFIEIWFEFASTYSYLTICRAEALLREVDVDFVWRPFLLGPIFREKGMETSPFVLDPVKGEYMWRDLERRSALFNLPFQRPPIFPMNGLRAARIMTAALEQHWCGAFARAVFIAQFTRGDDIFDENVLREAINGCGVDADTWLSRAQDDLVKAKLLERTNEARNYGIFGAPSFRVQDEIFWGDDRLEDAIQWAVRGRKSRPRVHSVDKMMQGPQR